VHKDSPKENTKTIFVLFDLSESTRSDRPNYLSAFKTIFSRVNYGDAIACDKITALSVSQSAFPVNSEFAPLELPSNILLKKIEKAKADTTLQASKDSILITVEKMLNNSNEKIMATDILSSLLIAERVLNGHRKDKSILVIMSDMIEASNDYNFYKENLTDNRINEIIKIEKQKGRLPDLTDVQVYIIGAKGIKDKYTKTQNFWIEYFTNCGAILYKQNYGSALLRFDE